MDLSQLGESAQYMVPLIILFCMCIGYVIKTSLDFIENKYIPLIMVSIGIGLNIPIFILGFMYLERDFCITSLSF